MLIHILILILSYVSSFTLSIGLHKLCYKGKKMFITIQNFIFAFSVNLQKQKGFHSTATFQIMIIVWVIQWLFERNVMKSQYTFLHLL